MGNFLTFLCEATTQRNTKIGRVLGAFSDMVDDLIYPFLIAFAAAGILYSIYLGVNYSRSEGDARKEAQKRIVNFIIGFVSIVVLLLLLKVFCNQSDNIIKWIEVTFYK